MNWMIYAFLSAAAAGVSYDNFLRLELSP